MMPFVFTWRMNPGHFPVKPCFQCHPLFFRTISTILRMSILLQNEAILLIHFSQRYSAEAIVEHLHRALPPSLRDKCTPLLQGYS